MCKYKSMKSVNSHYFNGKLWYSIVIIFVFHYTLTVCTLWNAGPKTMDALLSKWKASVYVSYNIKLFFWWTIARFYTGLSCRTKPTVRYWLFMLGRKPIRYTGSRWYYLLIVLWLQFIDGDRSPSDGLAAP